MHVNNMCICVCYTICTYVYCVCVRRRQRACAVLTRLCWTFVKICIAFSPPETIAADTVFKHHFAYTRVPLLLLLLQFMLTTSELSE